MAGLHYTCMQATPPHIACVRPYYLIHPPPPVNVFLQIVSLWCSVKWALLLESTLCVLSCQCFCVARIWLYFPFLLCYQSSLSVVCCVFAVCSQLFPLWFLDFNDSLCSFLWFPGSYDPLCSPWFPGSYDSPCSPVVLSSLPYASYVGPLFWLLC